MPESRTYIVTRTQRVKVTANTHADAERIAIAALDGTPAPADIWGHTERTDPESATIGLTTERI